MSQENIETKLLINIGWGMFGYISLISFASMPIGFPKVGSDFGHNSN